EICLHTTTNQPFCTFTAYPGQNAILWDIVCSHGKDFYSIDDKTKLISPLIFLSTYCNRPQSNSTCPFIAQLLIRIKFYTDSITWLFPIAIWPPYPRIFYT